VVGAEPAIWKTLLTLVAFSAKTFFFILMFMLVRWTVPRFRYDQVMDLGWKIMLPTALVVVMVTSGTILALDSAGVEYGPVYGLVLTAVNLVMLGILVWIVDRGNTIGGGDARQQKRAHARIVAEFRQQEWGTHRAPQDLRTPAGRN
jgi:NADH-quinone oxidoreductase subunit H